MRSLFIAFSLAITACWPLAAHSEPGSPECLNIYHDEFVDETATVRGPINAIMLANMLGHWPQYEVRVQPITDFETKQLDACKATFYLGSNPDTEIPQEFLDSYFSTSRSIAWVGFGQQQLDQKKFMATFKHIVDGILTVDNPGESQPEFYQHVVYKDRVFNKSVDKYEGKPQGAFQAVRFSPTDKDWSNHVLARLVHNKTHKTSSYFLRAGKKFIVGDIPMSYMHEGDRYFAFADLLFDVLEEQPENAKPLAFARTEDIHGLYEKYLLDATLATHRAEKVPMSIAHIPLFADPFNSFGAGEIKTAKPANEKPEFLEFIRDLLSDDRSTVVWHGVTHQLGNRKNPHSGASGDDYEFWNMTYDRPAPLDTPTATVARLKRAMPVFEAYKAEPRFWVTPHYRASAINARVFGELIPWNIGRVTYYPSSFGQSFTIPAADRSAGVKMPSVDRELLDNNKDIEISDADLNSAQGLTQMFPYVIYRDVYGQRIIPETLGYLSYATSEQTSFVRTVDHMLADARRNSVVRDYWASFFYHPYIFSNAEDGGIGRFAGDTIELRKLFIGLKLLGYNFTGLSEFESSIKPARQLGAVVGKQPTSAN